MIDDKEQIPDRLPSHSRGEGKCNTSIARCMWIGGITRGRTTIVETNSPTIVFFIF